MHCRFRFVTRVSGWGRADCYSVHAEDCYHSEVAAICPAAWRSRISSGTLHGRQLTDGHSLARIGRMPFPRLSHDSIKPCVGLRPQSQCQVGLPNALRHRGTEAQRRRGAARQSPSPCLALPCLALPCGGLNWGRMAARATASGVEACAVEANSGLTPRLAVRGLNAFPSGHVPLTIESAPIPFPIDSSVARSDGPKERVVFATPSKRAPPCKIEQTSPFDSRRPCFQCFQCCQCCQCHEKDAMNPQA